MADWKAWWLAQTPGWGAVRLRQLIECIESEQQILDLLGVCEGPEQLQQWIQTGWMESEAAVYGESLKIKAVDVRRLWEHRLCQNQKKDRFERCYPNYTDMMRVPSANGSADPRRSVMQMLALRRCKCPLRFLHRD